MEIALIVVAAAGLLGCFGSVVTLDMTKERSPRRPVRLAER